MKISELSLLSVLTGPLLISHGSLKCLKKLKTVRTACSFSMSSTPEMYKTLKMDRKLVLFRISYLNISLLIWRL